MGTLYLGSTVFTEENLDGSWTEPSQIRASLSQLGNILLYGCDVGAGTACQTYIEQLSLCTGAGAVDASDTTGNAMWKERHLASIENVVGGQLSDMIIGNGGNNQLDGQGGDDTLNAGAGADTLVGGTGADVMAGGLGDDFYIVDNLGDIITENLNEGTDVAIVNVGGYTLAANVEFAVVGIVNGLSLSGNTLNNLLIGNNGNDTLSGGSGVDTLAGGAGADRFRILTISDSGNTAATADVVADFVHGTDVIDLSALDANTSTATNDAFLFGGQTASALSNRVTWSQDGAANRTIVRADVTGDTTAEIMLVLTGLHNLDAADFIL